LNLEGAFVMTIYENRIYKKCRSVYYVLLNLLYSKNGVPISINNYSFRFVPKYYRYYTRDYEHENFKFMARHVKTGMTCIDIGAHFGLFSIFLAKYFQCKVYSFEPTPYTQKILARNVALNHVENNIEIIPKAVTLKDDVRTFYIQERQEDVANSLIDYHHSNEHKMPYQVQVTSIDSFSREKKIDFIKIDAEGEELQVLIGGKNTIEKHRPLILLSLHRAAMDARGDTLKMVWDLLIKYDYTVYYENQKYNEEAFCNQPNMFDVALVPNKL
jgi:methyltransferase, FkbM family